MIFMLAGLVKIVLIKFFKEDQMKKRVDFFCSCCDFVRGFDSSFGSRRLKRPGYLSGCG